MPSRKAIIGDEAGGKEKETFGCPFPGCGQSYSRMEYLKRHQRKHQDVRPFQCKDCSKAFARSDVLLRHRRRCHPTPPPHDRDSNSPPGPARSHPSVPISSSRTDAREASPSRRGRGRTGGQKHPRQSSGDSDVQNGHGHANSRPRLDSDDDEIDDDTDNMEGARYAENLRYRDSIDTPGVYNFHNQYYPAGLGESSTYTPHLLPMFQQSHQPSQTYPNQHDPHHLEDASVLLSMAYPGGLPGASDGSSTAPTGNTGTTVNGEAIIGGQRVVPDWAGGQTINMMMESNGSINGSRNGSGSGPSRPSTAIQPSPASVNGNGSVRGNGSFSSNGNDPNIDPVLTDDLGMGMGYGNTPMGMGLNMGWLNAMVSGDKDGGNATEGLGWPISSAQPSPGAASPYSLSALFSPSAFGLLPGTTTQILNNPTILSPSFSHLLPQLNGNGMNGFDMNNNIYQDNLNISPSELILDPDENQNAMSQFGILDALAMHEVPQTRTNPNPERPLLRIGHSDMWNRAGKEIDQNSPFYLPAERFGGCYQVPHWALPPLRTLSLMASRTFKTVLNHFPFVHGPTFRLMDTAACLAFAICTIPGVKLGISANDYPIDWAGQIAASNPNVDSGMEKVIDGPLPNGRGWETIYRENWKGTKKSDPFSATSDPDEDAKEEIEEWGNGSIVRHEKTNMLVKSFALAQGVLMTEYNVALLQALILYHAPFFLSQDERERGQANMFLGTIVNITRQIGFFIPELEHFEVDISLPIAPYTPNELDRAWKRWISLESRRRTAYLVYHLDTISALESNIPPLLSSCEVAMIPLPAPDTLWKAPTADAWLKAVQSYKPMTLDEAMRRIFFLPTFGAFDSLHEKAAKDTAYYNLLNESDYGPFARVAMVITLLRGIIDIGEGKRDRGDWRDLTDLWVSCSWLRPTQRIVGMDGKDLGLITKESLRGRFSMGLERWRQGWDFDSLCLAHCPNKMPPTNTVKTDSISPYMSDLNTPDSVLSLYTKGLGGNDSVSPVSSGGTAPPSKIGVDYSTPNSNGSSNKPAIEVKNTEKPQNDTQTGPGQAWEPPKDKLNYCEEALPFYWLAQALLNILNSVPGPQGDAGWNAFSGIRYGEMLKSARMFTRMGEGTGCGM